MKIYINDLSFRYMLYDRKDAVAKVHEWLDICKILESTKVKKCEAIYSCKIDVQSEIAPGYKIIQLLQEFQTADEQLYLLDLLANRSRGLAMPAQVFEMDGKTSQICVLAQDGMLVSIKTDKLLADTTIDGEIASTKISLRNLASEEHIDAYGVDLGIRKYEANPKHGRMAYAYSSKGKIASPMDLCDEKAQEMLDSAVEVKGKLYGRYDGKYYAIQCTRENIYHAYIVEDMDTHLKNAIDKELART